MSSIAGAGPGRSWEPGTQCGPRCWAQVLEPSLAAPQGAQWQEAGFGIGAVTQPRHCNSRCGFPTSVFLDVCLPALVPVLMRCSLAARCVQGRGTLAPTHQGAHLSHHQTSRLVAPLQAKLIFLEVPLALGNLPALCHLLPWSKSVCAGSQRLGDFMPYFENSRGRRAGLKPGSAPLQPCAVGGGSNLRKK